MLEHRYGQDIYNAMNDAIFIADRMSLQIIYANRVLADVLHTSQRLLLQMSLLDLYTEEDQDIIREHIARMHEQMVRFGAHLKPHEGEPLYVDTRLTPGQQDGRLQLVGAISNPGQPSLAQALYESQTLYRSLVEALSDLIFRIREDGTFLDSTLTKNLQLNDTPPDSIIGRKIADFVSQQDTQVALAAIERALITRHPETIHFPYELSYGLHHFECCFVPSLEKEVIAIVRDITPQKQQETLLRLQRDLAIALSFETSLDRALERIIEAAMQVTEMECGGIYLVDPVSSIFQLACWRGISDESAQSVWRYEADAPQARLVLEGQPYYLLYSELGDSFSDMLRRERLQTTAILPVLHKNRVIACIIVSSRTAFDIPHIVRNALENIAAQVGSAIVRIQIEESLRRRDRLLEAVSLATNRLMETGEQDTCFNEALAILGEEIGADRVFVYECHVQPETNEPVTSQRYGWSSRYVTEQTVGSKLQNIPWQSFGLQSWYDSLSANQVVMLSRDTVRQFVPPDVPLAYNIESLLLVPIIVGGKFWGAIGFSDHRYERIWGGEEISILRVMAASVGSAIERQQAEDQLRHEHAVATYEREVANTLREVGMVLTSTLELDTVLARILGQVRRVIPYDAANVFLVENGVPRMVHHHGYESFGLSNEYISQISLNCQQWPNIQALITQGQPAVCSDVPREGNWRKEAGFEWVKSWLGVPIVVRGQVVAIFSLDSTIENFYNVDHVRLIEPFTQQAAIAFENARLFEDTQRLERIKSEMIRIASHDLSSPLTRVKEAARQMKQVARELDLPDELCSKYGNAVEDAVNEMEQIVLNILSVERIEAQHHAARSIIWCELLAESIRTVRSDLEAKHHELTIVCEPDLPVVRGIPAQLQSAMSNLIGNAIKYTPPGGQIQVRLAKSRYGDIPTIAFEVEDNGIGIPPALQEQLFEPFYRAVQPGAEATTGLGLGLSIVKATIRFHKGRVYFDSVPDRGSLFGFWIPV